MPGTSVEHLTSPFFQEWGKNKPKQNKPKHLQEGTGGEEGNGSSAGRGTDPSNAPSPLSQRFEKEGEKKEKGEGTSQITAKTKNLSFTCKKKERKKKGTP